MRQGHQLGHRASESQAVMWLFLKLDYKLHR